MRLKRVLLRLRTLKCHNRNGPCGQVLQTLHVYEQIMREIGVCDENDLIISGQLRFTAPSDINRLRDHLQLILSVTKI